MMAIARAVLDDPHWGWQASRSLGAEVKRPLQYARAGEKLWPGAAMHDDAKRSECRGTSSPAALSTCSISTNQRGAP